MINDQAINEIKTHLKDYLEEFKPNILVITGHDAMYKRNNKTTSVKLRRRISSSLQDNKII